MLLYHVLYGKMTKTTNAGFKGEISVGSEEKARYSRPRQFSIFNFQISNTGTRLLLLILAKLTVLAKLRSHRSHSTACEPHATTIDSVSATESVMQIPTLILDDSCRKRRRNTRKITKHKQSGRRLFTL